MIKDFNGFVIVGVTDIFSKVIIQSCLKFLLVNMTNTC